MGDTIDFDGSETLNDGFTIVSLSSGELTSNNLDSDCSTVFDFNYDSSDSWSTVQARLPGLTASHLLRRGS